MPPRRVFTGSAAATALMGVSQKLHGALMVAMAQGGTVMIPEVNEAITETVRAIERLAAYLKSDQVEGSYTDLEPLSMIGTWHECNDGIVHNISQWGANGWHDMACLDKRQIRKLVTTAEGQNFCDGCLAMAFLPGTDID